MNAATARIAAWGVLIGLIIIGFIIIVINRIPQQAERTPESVSRNVSIALTPKSIPTQATTTVSIGARSDEGDVVAAWQGGTGELWLVRNDLTYATHLIGNTQGATSSFTADIHPTQPGIYKAVATGVKGGTVTIGAATLSISGSAEDHAPNEQSAGREGYKVVLNTVPDTGAIKINTPTSLTFNVSRTGSPVILDQSTGQRGNLVAFHINGTLFVRGEPAALSLLPSASAAAFTLSFPEPGKYRVFFEFTANGHTYMEARWIEVSSGQ